MISHILKEGGNTMTSAISRTSLYWMREAVDGFGLKKVHTLKVKYFYSGKVSIKAMALSSLKKKNEAKKGHGEVGLCNPYPIRDMY